MIGFEGLGNAEKRGLFFIASNALGKVAEVCKEKGMGQEAVAASASKQRFLLKMMGTYTSTVSIIVRYCHYD